MTSSPLRILVTGGRDFADLELICRTLSQFSGTDVILAHGDCRGADRLCEWYAKRRGWKVVAFPAEWQKLGRGAGHVRNQRMLDEFKPHVLVAFPGNRGTADMVARTRRAGVRIVEVI